MAVAAKMAATAAFVVLATRVAERAGPLIGAMIATLPLSAAPSYVFVALDHPPEFIAGSALGSLAGNATNIVFCLVYARAAQRFGTAVSLGIGFGVWVICATVLRSVTWTLPAVLLLNAAAVAVCLPLANRLRHAAMPRMIRRWYDVPLRAGMVAVLVTIVVTISSHVGATVTGLLAIFPIVLTSVILIFHPRVGGPATAALIANAIIGLAGFAIALTVLHLTAMPLGSAGALCAWLLMSLLWNVSVVMMRRRGVTATAGSARTSP